jgi:hypothetical protein
MATMFELPVLPFARPGPGATRQQVADYHCRMLVADGVIPSTSFSPFEPSGDANGADYFFGRAPRRPFAEEALALPFGRSGPLAFAEGCQGRGGPLAFADVDGQESLVFGPPLIARASAAAAAAAAAASGRRTAALRAEEEDALIAQQLSEAYKAERKLLDSLAVSADDGEDFIKEAQRGEEFIQEQVRLVREVQRLRGFAQPLYQECAAPPPTEPDTELEAALALSTQLAADTESAALEQGLALSEAVADNAATLADTIESAQAGVDIPFTTPSTLIDDSSSFTTPSSSAAGARKQGSRGKGKHSKGKDAQV